MKALSFMEPSMHPMPRMMMLNLTQDLLSISEKILVPSWQHLKKQKITADSSTIAEFIATHIVAKEILWCRRLLCSLGYPQLEPTILFEDNKSTISMIKNKCNGKRTKHIDVRYNLIRELCEKMVIAMNYLASGDMTSDTLTKS